MFAIMRPDAFCTFLRFIPSAPSQLSILDQAGDIQTIFNLLSLPPWYCIIIHHVHHHLHIITTVSAKIVAWGNSQWLRVCGEFSEDLACLSSLTGSLPDALYHHPFIARPVALQKLWYIMMHGYNLLNFLSLIEEEHQQSCGAFTAFGYFSENSWTVFEARDTEGCASCLNERPDVTKSSSWMKWGLPLLENVKVKIFFFLRMKKSKYSSRRKWKSLPLLENEVSLFIRMKSNDL